VRVDDEGAAEDGVHDWVERAAGEGGDGERDERGCDEAGLELVCAVIFNKQ
jgi:hypothetical protein